MAEFELCDNCCFLKVELKASITERMLAVNRNFGGDVLNIVQTFFVKYHFKAAVVVPRSLLGNSLLIQLCLGEELSPLCLSVLAADLKGHLLMLCEMFLRARGSCMPENWRECLLVEYVSIPDVCN